MPIYALVNRKPPEDQMTRQEATHKARQMWPGMGGFAVCDGERGPIYTVPGQFAVGFLVPKAGPAAVRAWKSRRSFRDAFRRASLALSTAATARYSGPEGPEGPRKKKSQKRKDAPKPLPWSGDLLDGLKG